MISGKVTAAEFPDLLRSLAQKRKNGVLSLILGEDRTMDILLFQSKLGEVVLSDVSASREVADALALAGAIDEDAVQDVMTYKEIEAGLDVPGEIVRRAVRARLLEKIETLRCGEGISYDFKPSIPDFEREYSPLIPVSQFLLSYVTIESVRARFEGIFEPTLSVRGSAPDDESTEYERVILDILAGGEALGIEELQMRALLSSHSFRETLLGLYEGGLVTLEEAAAGLSPSVPPPTPVEPVRESVRPPVMDATPSREVHEVRISQPQVIARSARGPSAIVGEMIQILLFIGVLFGIVWRWLLPLRSL